MSDPLYIGCSGFYYPAWKNSFYPRGLKSSEWLTFYSSVFNAVELNGTFYRLPRLSDLQRYRDITPDDFRFSVKVSRYLTHTLRLKDCRERILDFTALLREGLGDKLLCCLFQMPSGFVYTGENLHNLLQSVPRGNGQVLEFRHPSWWAATAVEAIHQAGLVFCNVDYPGLDVPLVYGTGNFYLRLHGKPLLFKSSYSTWSLRAFAAAVPSAAPASMVFFNNTYFDAGYRNALAFQRLSGVDKNG